MAGGTIWDVVADILLEGLALCQSRHTPEGTRQFTPEQGHCRETVSYHKLLVKWRKTRSIKQYTHHWSLALSLTKGIRNKVYQPANLEGG